MDATDHAGTQAYQDRRQRRLSLLRAIRCLHLELKELYVRIDYGVELSDTGKIAWA